MILLITTFSLSYATAVLMLPPEQETVSLLIINYFALEWINNNNWLFMTVLVCVLLRAITTASVVYVIVLYNDWFSVPLYFSLCASSLLLLPSASFALSFLYTCSMYLPLLHFCVYKFVIMVVWWTISLTFLLSMVRICLRVEGIRIDSCDNVLYIN